MSQVPASLSVDLEYFQHAPAFRRASGSTDVDAIGREAVPFIRKALAGACATGTFFTVSSILEDDAGLVASLAADGHEIASHTHTHRHLSDLSTADRREELLESRDRLQAVAGTEVRGFRAPSFDVPPDHFEHVAAAGYSYDSSVVPSRSIPGWYGGEFDAQRICPAASIDPGASEELIEVPVAVLPGLRLPLAGTWIRFFGVHYTILGMRLLARRGIPPVLYVHPWELVDIPPIEGVPSRIYWRTGAYMRRALTRILAEPFEFVSVDTLASEWNRRADTSSDAAGPEASG